MHERDLRPEAVPAPAPAAGLRGSALPAFTPVQQLLALQRSAGNAAVARLITGNPQEVQDSTGAATTVHAAPTIADAANHAPPPEAGGQSLLQPVGVRVKAGESAPIVAMAAPSAAELYEEAPAPTQSTPDAAPATSAFQEVSELRGTVAQPVITQTADNSLFIEPPGPTHDDVHQGQIGDCWDMATFMAIVHRDPNKIRSIMSPDGNGGATVTLQHRVVQPPAPGGPPVPTHSYAAEQVQVSEQLAFDRDMSTGAGPGDRVARTVGTASYGHAIHGAQLRAAPDPRERRWFASVVGRTLEVHCVETYQMARWAPLLEKAGARFSETYGQYGHGGQVAAEGEQTGTSGYANIEGGFSAYTVTMFYGQQGEQSGAQAAIVNTAWMPTSASGADVLNANRAAFDGLLSIAGQGMSAVPGQAQTAVVTAAGDDNATYINRLDSAIAAAKTDAAYRRLPRRTRGDVNTLKSRIDQWKTATPDPSPMPAQIPPNCVTARERRVIANATRVADPDRNPGMTADASGPAVRALLDMVLVVKNLGTDESFGTRSVYANHEYAVLGLRILGTDGHELPIQDTPAAQRPAMYPQVDVVASKVRMRNPHHTNVYDPAGTQSGDDTGVFEVSLDSFFRLFSSMMAATVTTTSPPPGAPPPPAAPPTGSPALDAGVDAGTDAGMDAGTDED